MVVRSIVLGVVLSVAVAAQVQGQSSIGVSAVIVEPVTAGPVQVDLRAEAGRLSVRRPASAVKEDSGILRHTFVRDAESDAGAGAAASRSLDGHGGRLDPGTRVLMDVSRRLVITRVVAANS